METLICDVWSKLGLCLNFVGPVMAAYSLGENLEEAHQMDSKGRKIYLASLLYPKFFRWGLIFIGLGFLLQIIN